MTSDENYKKLVEQFLKKCRDVQNDNERFVLRINAVKKQLRRYDRDVSILKRRLDKHNDNWQMVPMVLQHPKRKTEQKRGPKPKPKPVPAIRNEEGKVKKTRKPRTKKEPLPVTTNQIKIVKLTETKDIRAPAATNKVNKIQESKAPKNVKKTVNIQLDKEQSLKYKIGATNTDETNILYQKKKDDRTPLYTEQQIRQMIFSQSQKNFQLQHQKQQLQQQRPTTSKAIT